MVVLDKFFSSDNSIYEQYCSLKTDLTQFFKLLDPSLKTVEMLYSLVVIRQQYPNRENAKKSAHTLIERVAKKSAYIISCKE